jgi:CheY-like chemotaxis protein
VNVQTASQLSRPNGPPPIRKTVLLVDDHVDTGMVIRMLLERQGFTVYVAHTASEAMETARQKEFDLVISDIGLPDESGIDLLPKLLAIRNVPAIALSGFGTDEDRERSRQAGFREHILKPFNLPMLRQTIDRLLAQPNA